MATGADDEKPSSRKGTRRFVPSPGNGTGGDGRRKRRMSVDTLQDLVETIAAKTEANTQAISRFERRFIEHTEAEQRDRTAIDTRLEAIQSMLGNILARLPDVGESKASAPAPSPGEGEGEEKDGAR